MRSVILRTKFFKPEIHSDHVVRTHLFSALDKRAISLVCAPAGYGKSSLVTSWLDAGSRPHVWVSISEEDNEYFQFVQCLAEGIKHFSSDFGTDVLALLKSTGLAEQKAITMAFINDVCALATPLTLLVDDYHFITSEEIHDLFIQLMRYPIPEFKLVVIARADPPFPLEDWRVQNKLTDIRLRELIFTKEDINEFSEHLFGEPLSDDFLLKISKITGGWVTALRVLSIVEHEKQGLEVLLSNRSLEDLFSYPFLIIARALLKSPVLNPFISGSI